MKRALWIYFVGLAAWGWGQEKPYRTTTPLPDGRQMHGAVVASGYLYAMGGLIKPGELNDFTKTVIKSRISPDGALGAWEETAPLPQTRCYIANMTFESNGYIYIVQGLNGKTQEKYQTILWTRPKADGQLEPWKESSPCPSPGVACSVAVDVPGSIYVLGGSIESSKPVQTVSRAMLGLDGSIQSWSEGPPLPIPLWFHCAGVLQGKLYVWGGLTGSSSKEEFFNHAIYASSVQPDGSLGAWEENPLKLERGLYSAACAVSGNYLLAFCPRYVGGAFSGDVWFTRVGPQGLSPWTQLACEIPVKLYIGAATDYERGNVYIPGGRISKANLLLDPVVYYFPLSARQGGAGGSEGTPVAAGPGAARPQFSAASEQANASGPGAAAQPRDSVNSASMALVSNPANAGVGQAPSGAPAADAQFGAQPGAPSAPSPAPDAGFPAGFLDVQAGQKMFQKGKTALVFYFFEPGNPACLDQNQLMSAFKPQYYQSKIVFTAVEMSKFPQLVQQYNITKTPSWLFLDSQGVLIDRKHRELRPEELASAVRLILP